MALAVRLPSTDLRIDQIIPDQESVTIIVTSTQSQAACPLCAVAASRVQSRYVRKLADLPLQGTPVRVFMHVRRFFCERERCRRRIFTERMPAMARPHGRRTQRLEQLLEDVGFALGGEGGARLAGRLNVPTSPDTLLRRIRGAAPPPSSTPRALGIDDWALRRGQRYGTLLVDLEARRPVDLLPDRDSESVARWLREHPGVEVISRDRAQVYAEGARQGAPQATQVADRFHLVQNLGEAVERLMARNHKLLRAAAEAAATATEDASVIQPPVADEPTPVSELIDPAPEPPKPVDTRRERRLSAYEHVLELQAKGLGVKKIARLLAMSPLTVRRYVRAGSFPEHAGRTTILEPYLEHLRQRWEQGCHNSAELWREIRERGFRGSYPSVRRLVGQWRAGDGRSGRGGAPVKTAVPALSSRKAMWLLMLEEERLEAHERKLRDHLLELCPQAAQASALASSFRAMLRGREACALDVWLGQAKHSGVEDIQRFAEGLERDKAEVVAAVTLPWSNGPVEGHVHRIKLIKRQMYGRANFDLLRARVLRAA